MTKFLEDDVPPVEEERHRVVMFIEPAHATVYIGKQNPLIAEDTSYVDDLVVEVGRSQFFFEADSVTLELNSQIEWLLNGSTGEQYINLALPRSLSYAAHNNTINRQQVYQWLTRITRRDIKKRKDAERDRTIAVKALNEAAKRKALTSGNIEVQAEILDAHGAVLAHTTAQIEASEVVDAVPA